MENNQDLLIILGILLAIIVIGTVLYFTLRRRPPAKLPEAPTEALQKIEREALQPTPVPAPARLPRPSPTRCGLPKA
jgi:hypothetical protein